MQFCCFDGQSTGIIANQPNWFAGVLDCDASRKAARFVRFAMLSIFPSNIGGRSDPLLNRTKYAGIISHGAKLMFAYGEATVPCNGYYSQIVRRFAHVMSCKQPVATNAMHGRIRNSRYGRIGSHWRIGLNPKSN